MTWGQQLASTPMSCSGCRCEPARAATAVVPCVRTRRPALLTSPLLPAAPAAASAAALLHTLDTTTTTCDYCQHRA